MATMKQTWHWVLLGSKRYIILEQKQKELCPTLLSIWIDVNNIQVVGCEKALA